MKSKLLKLFYRIYLPLFAERNSIVYSDPDGKWYALYYSDLERWVFKNGNYNK